MTDMHSSATDFFCWALAGANWWLRSSVRRRNGATSHCATVFRIRRSLTASAGSYLRDNCDQPLIYRRAGWFRTLSFTGTCLGSRSRLGAAFASWLGWSVLRTESTNRGRLFLRRGDEACRQLVGRHPGRIHVVGGRGSVEMVARDVRDTDTAGRIGMAVRSGETMISAVRNQLFLAGRFSSGRPEDCEMDEICVFTYCLGAKLGRVNRSFTRPWLERRSDIRSWRRG